MLGNHGIIPPNVSIGWDMMPDRMLNFFLETFERDRRENMYEVLQSYLNNEKNQVLFKEIPREHEVQLAITENIYIDNNEQVYFKEQLLPNVTLQNGKCCAEVYDDNVVMYGECSTAIINNKTGNAFVIGKTYDSIEYVDNNKIYYSIDGDHNVYLDEYSSETGDFLSYKLRKATNNGVWAMSGNGNGKFIFLEYNIEDNTYEIYHNEEKVCSLCQDEIPANSSAWVLYDEVSENWLVLMTCANNYKGIVINKKGKCFEIALDVDIISDSVSFYKNTIYCVGNRKIYMYNVISNKLKSIYCDITNCKSSIERVDDKFIIINEKTTHIYVKS